MGDHSDDNGHIRLPDEFIDRGFQAQPGAAFALYLALLRHRDHKTGKCHPGTERLKRMCGSPGIPCTNRTISRYRQVLIDLGWIEVLKNGTGRDTSVYGVMLPNEVICRHDRSLGIDRVVSSDTSVTGDSSVYAGVTELSTQGRQICLPEPYPMDHTQEPVLSRPSSDDDGPVEEIQMPLIEDENEITPEPEKKKKSTVGKNLKWEQVDEQICEAIQKINRELYNPEWEFGNLNKSRDEIRMLRTIGGGSEKHGKVGPVSIDRIRAALTFLRKKDDFWFRTGNMRSGKAFRDAFPAIETKMKNGGANGSAPRDDAAEAKRAFDESWNK